MRLNDANLVWGTLGELPCCHTGEALYLHTDVLSVVAGSSICLRLRGSGPNKDAFVRPFKHWCPLYVPKHPTPPNNCYFCTKSNFTPVDC